MFGGGRPLVSLSVRYPHSWRLMLDMRDIDRELALVRAFVKDVATKRVAL